jgi:excinuclease ABC subunit C
VAAIREVQATLKPKPGVYRMLDARGDVLYVGKARALKNRVANYTQVERLPLRLKRMVSQTRSMTIVTTNSEAEALLLEAQLIKRYRPPYNVLLRDDKSSRSSCCAPIMTFPDHQASRRAAGQGQLLWPLRQRRVGQHHDQRAAEAVPAAICTDSFFSRRDRPCLLYQIKRCSAPCVGRIDEAGYAELVGEAKDFLGGRSSAVQRKIEAQMERRRRSAGFRTRGHAARPAARGDLHPGQPGDQCRRGRQCRRVRDGQQGRPGSAVQAFFIRGGQNWGHRAFFPAIPTGWTRPRC